MRDIEVMLSELEIDVLKFEGIYFDSRNQELAAQKIGQAIDEAISFIEGFKK